MKQTFILLKAYHSRLQIIVVAFFLFLCVSHAQAQNTKIDFDKYHANASVQASYTSDGYTSWVISDITTGNSESKTFDTGVTVKISHGSNTVGTKIKQNAYTNGLGSTKTSESNLISDGITSYNGDAKPTSGRVSILITLSGLTIGSHSVQAYHNYVEAGDDHNWTVPPIQVKVGNSTSSPISQTFRKTTLSESAKSFVTFDVTSENQEIIIEYYSVPQNGVDYSSSTTQFYINSLEIDPAAEAQYQAQNPLPANMDYHADVDNGSVTLTWTAAEGATSHRIYFGNSESEVRNATNWVEETENTSHTRNGLDPLQNYYWRIDEVIDGQVYKGEVWSFKARRLAFPGAEGAGKYAIGGRGGDVYHVTNLNDSGEGSLRYGIENASGPRTIVFDVSGVIQLQSRLVCNKPYITIAGQTAPGIGIMLRDYEFGANSDDGITRFMRFRYGHGDDWNGTSANQNTGNAGGLSANYGIMDHCLLGWGSDETFSTRGAKNVTFQHSLIGESLNQNGHKNYWDENHSVQHGYAATVGGDVASLHHNLLAHNEGRNWSLGGGLDGTNHFAGRMNIYNNVCYNWGGRATDGGAHQVNFVGNYYKKGPSTTQNFIFVAQHEDNFAGTQEYYLNGNLRVSQDGNTKKSDTLNDTYKETFSNGVTIDWNTFVSSPYTDFYGLDESNVETAEAAFRNVLSDVGCNYESLDNNEKRLVQETLNGTTSKTGSRSRKAGLIDKESDSEGWDGLGIISETRDADWDTDGDGIPNWFETAKGWSTDGLNNNHTNQDQDFYTDLEVYLNWMACPHFIDLEVGVQKKIGLATYFAGYTNPTFTIASQESGISASISAKNLLVTASSSGLYTVQVKATQSGITLTRTFNFYVLPYQAPDENVYNEASTTTTTENINQSGNITWAFNDPNVPAVVSFGDDDVNALFTPKNLTVGSHLNFYGSNLDESLYQPTTKDNSASDNNAIQFYVSLKSGYTFTPTSISVKATRFVTDGGYLDISWYANGSSTKYISGERPNRDNDNPNYSTYTQNISNQSLTGTFGIKINIYNLNTNKQIGIKDIIINGKVSGEITKTSTDIILKETATVYPKFNNAKETKYTLPINNANVTLQRTLSSDYWNTLCLPFDVSGGQIAEVFGDDTKVSEFNNAVNNTIIFSSVENIRAGVPCVIKPTNTVENPVFEGVNLTSSSPMSTSNGSYRYDGHYICYDMKTDKTEYFLNARGSLNYPADDTQNHLKGLRGTFTIPSTSAASLVSLRVLFDEQLVSEGFDVVDGVDAISGLTNISTVYNLKGQVIGTTKDHLAKGIYIVNGKKIVIK